MSKCRSFTYVIHIWRLFGQDRVPARSWPATRGASGELLPPGREAYFPSQPGGGWELGCPAGDPEKRPLNCGGGPDWGPRPPQLEGLPLASSGPRSGRGWWHGPPAGMGGGKGGQAGRSLKGGGGAGLGEMGQHRSKNQSHSSHLPVGTYPTFIVST